MPSRRGVGAAVGGPALSAVTAAGFAAHSLVASAAAVGFASAIAAIGAYATMGAAATRAAATAVEAAATTTGMTSATVLSESGLRYAHKKTEGGKSSE